MNLAKLQDTKSIYKNQLYFYTLISNYQKEKLRKHSQKKKKENTPIYNCIKKNKMPGNEFNQGGERLVYRKL